MPAHADGSQAQALRQPDLRRVFDRASLSLEVTLERDHGFFTGFTENLSEGGLFVATHMPSKVGDRVILAMSLPGAATAVRTECEVRWLRLFSETSDAPPGMGLRFVRLSEDDKREITAFVARRATRLPDE